jgi:hypothetical protein
MQSLHLPLSFYLIFKSYAKACDEKITAGFEDDNYALF